MYRSGSKLHKLLCVQQKWENVNLRKKIAIKENNTLSKRTEVFREDLFSMPVNKEKYDFSFNFFSVVSFIFPQHHFRYMLYVCELIF